MAGGPPARHGWPPNHPCHEAWTLLAAIAARTDRIRIGALVTSNTFRHPAVLAKEAVTVDQISGRRLILGLGAGWHEGEHCQFGIPLPAPGERVDRLEEAIHVIGAAPIGARPRRPRGPLLSARWGAARTQTVQARIPLLIAAHRPRMLRIAARHADQWDTFPEMAGTATEGVTDSLEARVACLEAACVDAGRDPVEVRRSTWAESDVAGDEAKYTAFVRHHLAQGLTDFMTVAPRPADMVAFRRIPIETIPALRAELTASARS